MADCVCIRIKLDSRISKPSLCRAHAWQLNQTGWLLEEGTTHQHSGTSLTPSPPPPQGERINDWIRNGKTWHFYKSALNSNLSGWVNPTAHFPVFSVLMIRSEEGSRLSWSSFTYSYTYSYTCSYQGALLSNSKSCTLLSSPGHLLLSNFTLAFVLSTFRFETQEILDVVAIIMLSKDTICAAWWEFQKLRSTL